MPDPVPIAIVALTASVVLLCRHKFFTFNRDWRLAERDDKHPLPFTAGLYSCAVGFIQQCAAPSLLRCLRTRPVHPAATAFGPR